MLQLLAAQFECSGEKHKLVQHSWGAVPSSGQAWVGVLVQPDQLVLPRLPDPPDQACQHDVLTPSQSSNLCAYSMAKVSTFCQPKTLYAAEFQPQHSDLAQPKPFFVLVV